MRAISKEKFMDIYMKPTKEEYEKLQPCLTYDQVEKVLGIIDGKRYAPLPAKNPRYFVVDVDAVKQALKKVIEVEG